MVHLTMWGQAIAICCFVNPNLNNLLVALSIRTGQKIICLGSYHNRPILHLEVEEEPNSADQGPGQQRVTQCAPFPPSSKLAKVIQ